MVGYDPTAYELSAIQYGIAGAFSGAMTRLVCQPLDVLKIRFQLQLEPISNQQASKYHGLFQAINNIRTEEGVRALWKGHVPAQLLSILYGVSQFVSFELLTAYAWKSLPKKATNEWRPTLHFFCGGAAGCIATCMSQPFDVIRTRFVGQGEPKIYSSVVQAARTMITKEGPRSLYKGLLPTLIQIAPHSGLQFGFYTFLCNLEEKKQSDSSGKKIGWFRSIICGGVAGIGAKAVVYPLDLAKKRLQVQGFEEARKVFGKPGEYHGLVDCFAKIIKQEGLRGLYKGFSPSLLKAAMATGCHFCFYEQTCNAIRLAHYFQTNDSR